MKIHSNYSFFVCVTQKEITLFNKLTLGNNLAADKNLIWMVKKDIISSSKLKGDPPR